jgi:broad specificity phosphatase PhoE
VSDAGERTIGISDAGERTIGTGEAGERTTGAGEAAAGLPDGVQLWLVRHGETEWSRSGQHTSRTELPLTAAGEDQARALRAMLGELQPALVLSSPRRRAVDTAHLAGLTVDDIDADLVEWDYGDYEGRTSEQIRGERPGWSLWTVGAPNGETADRVGARADRVLTRAAGSLAEGPVVLFSHGHFSRVLAARWIGLAVSAGRNFLLGTAAPSVLSTQYGVPVVDRWNMPLVAERSPAGAP